MSNEKLLQKASLALNRMPPRTKDCKMVGNPKPSRILLKMNWIHLLTVTKDMPGLGESWDINVSRISDGRFAWQTSASDPREDEEAAIDTGAADRIADYIVENALGFESELIESLTQLATRDSSFSPLLDAAKARLGDV